MSPIGRTLIHLRRLGFIADVCERWLPHVNRRRDLFGVGDVIAFHPRDKIVLIVQATSLAHVGDRIARISRRPELALLLRAGVTVEVWGWELRGGDGQLKRAVVRPDDLAGVIIAAPRSRRQRKGERQRELFPRGA
jgi:hypothetical protein